MTKQVRLGLLFSVLVVVLAVACGEVGTPETTRDEGHTGDEDVSTPGLTLRGLVYATLTARAQATVSAQATRISRPPLYVYVTVASANIRECPAPTCPVVDGAVFGEALEVIEKQGEWYEIRLGAGAEAAYVHESVVSSSAVEQPAQAPTPAPEAAPTQAQPAPTSPLPAAATLRELIEEEIRKRQQAGAGAPPPVPTSPPAVCDCSGNIYNCSAFSSHAAAQACYRYCLGVVGYDVHWLDGDGDGVACETLP